MATPTVVASYSDTGNSGARTVNVPSVVSGDWIIAACFDSYGTNTLTFGGTGAGTWVPIGSQVGSPNAPNYQNMTAAFAYKIATGSGAYTVTVTPTNESVVMVLHTRGVQGIDGSQQVAAIAQQSSTNLLRAIGTTTATPDALLVDICGLVQFSGSAQTWTPPPGMTELLDISTPNFNVTTELSTQVLTASGATNTRTAVSTVGTTVYGQAYALFALAGTTLSSGVSMNLPELPGAMLAVEVAWGADLTAADTTWTWTDVTTDVWLNPGISVKNGRSDEAATTQPARCTMTLNNSSGRYSLGPQSINYPNVRRGTPIRVRLRPSASGSYVTVFQGSAVSWDPGWNLRGTLATVALEASGALRRLAQGTSLVQSPIKRYHTSNKAVVAYWPCEDGKTSSQIVQAVGTLPMTWGGSLKLADNSDIAASLPIPTVNNARVIADIPPYTPNLTDGSQGVRMVLSMPAAASAPADGSVLFRTWLTGTVARMDVRYGTGGSLAVRTYDAFGTQLTDTGAVAFGVDGRKFLISLEMYQSGGTVFYGLNALMVGDATYGSIPGSPSVSGTCGVVRRVQVGPDANLAAVAFGHVAVLAARSATDPLTDVQPQLNGYYGAETSTGRVYRVCGENGVPLTYINPASDGSSLTAITMDTQKNDTLMSILRASETTGRGLLFDGVTSGLYYRSGKSIENQTTALTVSATSGQLASGFDPVDDDQRLVNRATVTRTGGSSASYQDTSGPLGTAVVGTYEVSGEVSTSTDSAAALHASWLVSRGTVVGYRYPTVRVDLRAAPLLATSWLSVQPGSRIDVTGVSSVLLNHPTGTVSLLVEGVTHTFSDGEWTGEATCSPFDVWMIGSVGGAAVANDDAYVLVADGEGTTTSAITASSTSVTVSVPTGLPLWLTTATLPAEFPVQFSIGGWQINVTGISGASSPQTFTITAPGVSIPSGAAVSLWRPMRAGL